MPKSKSKRSGPKRSGPKRSGAKRSKKHSASKAHGVLRRLQNDVERKRSGDRKLLEDAFRAGERVGELKKHHKKKSAKRSGGKKKKSKKSKKR